MAYATVPQVKFRGGINAAEDYHLWRFSTPDELDAAIVEALADAAAYTEKRIPDDYASTDAGDRRLISLSESYRALQFLYEPLKSRKVTGTHWALDQEDSSRFAALIDTEYEAMADRFLEPFTDIGDTTAFARPTFQIGPVIDVLTDTSILTEEELVQNIVDRVRSLVALP